MIRSVNTNHRTVLQTIGFDSYREGALRIARCAQRVDLNHIDHPARSLSERTIDLLTGCVLLIPVLSNIIWIIACLLGTQSSIDNTPPQTIQPWTTAIEAAKKPPEIIVASVNRPSDKFVVIDRYTTLDKFKNNEPYESTYVVKRYADRFVVEKTSPCDCSETTYDKNWAIQAMHYKDDKMPVDVVLTRQEDKILLTGTKEGEDLNMTFQLTDPNTPWIQQPHGFQPFIVTNELEQFYAIDPSTSPPCLRTMTIKKKQYETSPSYGQTIKLTIGFASGVSSWLNLVDNWFHPDPKKNKLYKMDYGLRPFAWGQSERKK